MELQQTKTIYAVIGILLVLVAGYFLFTKDRATITEDVATSGDAGSKPMLVEVENTQMINGILPEPQGFPRDIPLEKGVITESAVTSYPEQNAQQLSVSYKSSKTVNQKYTEYKNYMTKAGYIVTEGQAGSPRAIFGTKADVNLSVVVSSRDGKTLVQLSYLLK